jgi:arylsulfatase A-like enzyme
VKNKTSESFTELVDVYPTLCEIANIKAPDYIQGKSLIPVLEDPTKILKKEVYTRYKEGEAVIDKNYSYTEFFNGETYLGNMLYDPENDKLVEKYKEKLKIMREKVNINPFE